ncbi:MAG: hypothetical protein ACJASM_002051 [Salibacteraceae bacterium]|jgi:hypothetical protein
MINSNKSPLTTREHYIKDLIQDRYDYISKDDAISFIKDEFGTWYTLEEIESAYSSVSENY